ncbi:MAG: hypothetical protein J1F05_05115 [Muribaculaceae bacterium]|nr:hypothetical protein [Muribaculaceae bacterium]
MKKIFTYFSAVALLLAANGCNSGSKGDNIVESAFNNCFAYVSDGDAGQFIPSLGYQVRINYTARTADVAIIGLKTLDGTTYPTITLTNLPWTYNEQTNWLVVSGRNIKSEISGFSNTPTFDSFTMRLNQRFIGSDYVPGLSLEYSLNGNTVSSSYPKQTCFGVTTSSSEMTGNFRTDETNYYVIFDVEKGTVNITMQSSRFIEQMPALDIELKDIPFTLDGRVASWSVDAITPTISDTPYEDFPITNLVGSFDFGGEYTMEFDCLPKTMGGLLFHVTTHCVYYYTKML